MKKFYSILLVALVAVFGFQSQAGVWVLGNTPFGNWKLDAMLELQDQGNDLYSITVKDVPSGKYFSIMLDADWNAQYGPAVKNSFPTGDWEAADVQKSTWVTQVEGDYTIEYNASTKQARITVANGQEVEDGYFLIGAFNGWSEGSQVAFNKEGDEFKLTQTFSGEFKIRDGVGLWYGNAGGKLTLTKDNPSVTLESGENLNLEAEAEYTLTIKDGVLTVSGFGDEPVVEPDPAYYLIGAFNGWDQSSQVEFEKVGEEFKLTQTFSGEFKIRDEKGTWYGGGVTFTAENPSAELVEGENFNLEAEAEYTLTIKDGVLTVSGFSETPAEDELLGVVIKGSADADWANITTIEFAKNEADAWEIAKREIPAGFEFKVVKQWKNAGEEWIGAVSNGKFYVTADMLDNEISLEKPGENLYFENGGEFAFTLAADFSKLVVSGEFAEAPEPVISYALAVAQAGDWENMQQVDLTEAEGVWTIKNYDVAAKTEFKVIEVVKVEGRDDALNWYGAESEGNFWLDGEDSQLDKELPLFTGVQYQNLYFDGEGTFNFTFNAENKTLVVTKVEAVENNGDLNGDGSVNTGDVSMLYDIILGNVDDPAIVGRANVNGDDSINTGDVSALYDIILGNK